MNSELVKLRPNERWKNIPEGFSLHNIPSDESLLSEAQLDITQDLPPPEPILLIRGDIWGTLGNFSTVIGKAKSRKTFLMVLLTSACLGWRIKGSELFEGMLREGKRHVAYVDTEQGTYHLLKSAQRVANILGNPNPSNFSVYCARPLSTRQRVQIIEELVKTVPDLGVIILDGIRDLVTSINDEEQATDLINKFLKWTEEKQIHIIIVLHQNKGDTNARGHIGTELMNKSETVVSISVDKNETLSKVEAEFCRNKAFDPFAFFINEEGLPEIIDDWVPQNQMKTYGKCKPHEIDDFMHTEILSRVGKNLGEKPNYTEVLDQIIDAVSKTVEGIGQSRAKEFFTHYKNQGSIIKHGKSRSPNTYYEVKFYDEN